ncbi:hypothetical protein [Nocardia sp. NPDC051463]|uniref:hypothetical protein n=1 Tax=Nocardia sp. NPDC051463 TaxID=3154845 RepID=UPI00344D024A
MPAETIATIAVALCLIEGGGICYLLARGPAYPPNAQPVNDILERIAAEGSLRMDSWDVEAAHRAPDKPFTIEEAHREMQCHRKCGVDACARKHSAQAVLVEAGRIKVDLRVGR